MGKLIKSLGVVSVLGFPVAVITKRLGIFEFRTSFELIKYTLLLAALVFIVGLLVSWLQKRKNPVSAKQARAGMFFSLLPLLGIGSQLFMGNSLPKIHNISTDTLDPPQFEKVVALRGANANSLEYEASVLAQQQKEAYPDVKTLLVATDPEIAFQRAVEVAKYLGWELVAQDSNQGIIEATDTTGLWQFQDDVVIRVRPQGQQTAIDLRSVSRVGISDLGANAKRITKFITTFEAQ